MHDGFRHAIEGLHITRTLLEEFLRFTRCCRGVVSQRTGVPNKVDHLLAPFAGKGVHLGAQGTDLCHEDQTDDQQDDRGDRCYQRNQRATSRAGFARSLSTIMNQGTTFGHRADNSRQAILVLELTHEREPS